MNRSIFRTAALTGAVLALGFAASGCASHRFVRDQVEVVDTRVTGVEGLAGEALARANAAHKLAEGKFLYEVVLSDDSMKFPTDQHALSPEAEARLAELTQRLKAENRNVYLEIQGHTDATGDEEYNEELGEARAEAVRRTLTGAPLLNDRSAASARRSARSVSRGPVDGAELPSRISAKWFSSAR